MNNDKILKKMLQGPDARSNRGTFARGKTRYGGAGTSPNPAGMNQHSSKNMLKTMRKRLGGM